ncbi:MAG: mechanosensitive ion channel protein MscS [Candidatus Nephrothrix sp. EaCA]|nr:MAG: mechanosensitive ion channel protein MscS [Candidatus Nephrothrix sp. EaCA]
MEDFLLREFYRNTIREYLIALGTFVGCVVLLKLFSLLVISRLQQLAEKTENTLDDFLVAFLSKTIMPVLYLVAFYFSSHQLNLHALNPRVFRIGYAIVITILSVRGFLSVIHYLIIKHATRNEGENAALREKQVKGFLTPFDLVAWTISLIFLLDNLGYNVSTLITGLGVSGIAIAIGAQAVLGDFFAYFVIFFDRPFNLGDYIEVDKEAGVIEYIGFKSTRLRTLTGDQLIVSNKDLTNARLHNYKKLKRRRVLFKLGVTYQTSALQLEAIPKIVEGIVRSVKGLTFDRGYFIKFSDSSLDFEFAYYCESPDLAPHIASLHEVNLKIFKTFAEQGIQFAYPTQTVYIQK